LLLYNPMLKIVFRFLPSPVLSIRGTVHIWRSKNGIAGEMEAQLWWTSVSARI